MNDRPPKLSLHKATGQYRVHWGGQDRYLGKDRAEAQKRYLGELAAWAEWRKSRDQLRLPPLRQPLLVAELVVRFLDSKERERGRGCRQRYERHLRRFNAMWGDLQADMIRAAQVQAFKEDLIGGRLLAPKTINHELTTISTLFHWAVDFEHIPPVNLRPVKLLRLPEPQPKALSWLEVYSMVYQAPERIGRWLGLQYLAFMRPSEVVKLVWQQGRWEGEGIYRLDGLVKGTTRRIVLSEEALGWLRACDPCWARPDGYSLAVRRACGPGGPHPLRHSAATHLLQQVGEGSRGLVDCLLGHTAPRVSRMYAPHNYPALRELAGRLSLKLAG